MQECVEAVPRRPQTGLLAAHFRSKSMLDGELTYTDEVARETAEIYERVKSVIPEVEWPIHAPYVAAINRLKKERNAVILGHNYMTPDIFHCVSDIVGDSLGLAQEAAKTDADVIVFAGVHFMAETAKITCPEKTVLCPDVTAGCSLAESITAQDVRDLRAKYPGRPIVTYVNTSADVKAEVDICCTSGNALKIIESLDSDEIVFIPDEYLASYIATQTKKKIITWQGHCEVHERFTGKELDGYREQYDGISIIAHPECPPDVLEASDFVGSTAQMIDHVKTERPEKVFLVTECSMSDNVAAEVPDVDFIRPCNLCPHMKKITLEKIYDALKTMEPKVEVDADVADRARRSVDAMLAVGR